MSRRKILERTLIRHAAPAMLGIKPSSLVSFSTEKYIIYRDDLEQIRRNTHCAGLRFLVLSQRRNVCHILVFRVRELADHLAQPAVQTMLTFFGYDIHSLHSSSLCGGPAEKDEATNEKTVMSVLNQLKVRIETMAEFPHEIGLFLGYPPADVKGYVKHRGKRCRMTGYWKVYANEKEARDQFAKFDRCREHLLACLDHGATIDRLWVAS